MAGNKGLRTRNWGDLDYDILVKILMTLNFLDLIYVSRVCSSWKEACCNPILWRKLDLTILPFNFFNTPRKLCTWSEDQSSQRLTGILKTALRLSCGNLHCLVLHFSVFKNDEHLIYAAERSYFSLPKKTKKRLISNINCLILKQGLMHTLHFCRTPALKQLVLPAWNPMTEAGFEKAIKNWERLESLAVASPGFPVKIMKLVGNYCKNLSKLKVMFPFDIDCAKAIVASTPKLKVLSLQFTRVYREALVCILSNMQQLEVLNITHSTVVEPTENPGFDELCEGIDESIMKQASGLKQFLFCQTDSCDVCKDSIFCDDDMFQWSRFEEKVWRVDEVSSLAF